MILLVDDDDVQRRVTAELLRADGWRVREAATAETALALVRVARPKIAVVDLVFHGDDQAGLNLLRQMIAEYPEWRDCRVIVTTAMPGELRDLPCDCVVLRKPFEVEELIDQIHKSAAALGVMPDVRQPAAPPA